MFKRQGQTGRRSKLGSNQLRKWRRKRIKNKLDILKSGLRAWGQ